MSPHCRRRSKMGLSRLILRLGEHDQTSDLWDFRGQTDRNLLLYATAWEEDGVVGENFQTGGFD